MPKLVDVIADHERQVFTGVGYVTDIELQDLPYQSERQLLIRRRYAQVNRSIDLVQREPAWLLFARARQGGE